MILINMEMPNSCLKCPMANKYNGYGPLDGCNAVPGKEYAAIDDGYDGYSHFDFRPSWCPLIEIKEPACETVVIKTPMPKFMREAEGE